MKHCPKCKSINPDIAERCDCGYDFPSGTMQASDLTAKDRRSRKGGALGGIVAFLLLMRFAGLLQGARRGAGPCILALGLLVLFIAAKLTLDTQILHRQESGRQKGFIDSARTCRRCRAAGELLQTGQR